MLWLLVLTREIFIVVIMICREFVQAKDRGIYLGLFQQTQQRHKLEILYCYFWSSFHRWRRERWRERLNAEPSRRLHSVLAQSSAEAVWQGIYPWFSLQPESLVLETCPQIALHAQQKAWHLSFEPQMAAEPRQQQKP